MPQPPTPQAIAWICAFLAAVLVAWLAALVRANLRRGPRQPDLAAVLEACRAIRADLDELKRMRGASEPPGSLAAASMSRRAQVLRLSRRGERPEHIAAALAMPASEVMFIVKTANGPPGPDLPVQAAATG
jgi:hypothetical protein